MSEDSATREASPSPRRPDRRALALAGWEAAAFVLTAAAVAGFGAYGWRREIGRTLAEEWLREQGVQSAVMIDGLSATGFSGRLRVGPAENPIVAADRIEVDLAFSPPWSGEPFKLEARAVRLVRPRVRMAFDGRKVSFGALDPLIDKLLKQPPEAKAPAGPSVIVEDGQLWLETPMGLIRLRGDAALDKGRLVRLAAALKPARLDGRDVKGRLDGGSVTVRADGERLAADIDLAVGELNSPGLDLDDARLNLTARLPYPDLKAMAARGPVTVDARASADSAGSAGVAASAVQAAVHFDGEAGGRLADGALSGVLHAEGRADAFNARGLDGRRARFDADLANLRLLSDRSGVRFSGDGHAALGADRAAQGGLYVDAPTVNLALAGLTGAWSGRGLAGQASLRAAGGAAGLRQGQTAVSGLRFDLAAPGVAWSVGDGAVKAASPVRLLAGAAGAQAPAAGGAAAALTALDATLEGRAALDRDGPIVDLRGAARAHGATPAGPAGEIARALPLIADDPGYRTAVARALESFDLAAPAVALTGGRGRFSVGLVQPVRLAAASGAALTLTQRGKDGAASFAPGGGARGGLALTVAGGGLPALALDAPAYAWDGRTLTSTIAAKGELNLGPAHGVDLDLAARIRAGAGTFSLDLPGCAPLKVRALAFGDNRIDQASGRLCEAGGPVFDLGGGAWRARGRFEALAGSIVAADARAEDGAGTFEAAGGPRGLASADLRLTGAALKDHAKAARFQPVKTDGRMTYGDGRWRGAFAVRNHKGGPLGEITLRHEDATGRGEADIDAGAIVFAKGGLQPGDLSPLAAFATPADGKAAFTGRFVWSKAGVTSDGRLWTDGLNLRSPAGPMTQIRGDVRFVSLTPLITAPGQTVTVERIDALSPISSFKADFHLTPDKLSIDGGQFDIASGKVHIETINLPLDPNGTAEGAVVLDGVDLGQLIAASSLADKVKVQAIVDGRLPFEMDAKGFRFLKGRIAARGPGRLSISRSALTGAQAADPASPGAPPPPAPNPNAIQDFAYQAMENLAFDKLEASVESLPGGRLSMLFHVNGRHDPPKPGQALVSVVELARGTAFNKPIPLPKDTPIDLTLDTSLNFAELLAAWRRGWVDEVHAAAETARSQPVQP
ncbi:hypothetical protein C5708_14295 [Caulobacter sp. CCUG 60055]|nr:YdbH domain-containing protein [Caulobacter sp. CCUG 60055]MCI3181421.1 hypothetical protein [Caulobacter sp. CCUG 60055]